jgi:hypothetical protein
MSLKKVDSNKDSKTGGVKKDSNKNSKYDTSNIDKLNEKKLLQLRID